MQVTEGNDVRFEDRAICVSADGPLYDERGFVLLRFPDNGYDDFVDPRTVFELGNYEEIDRLPPQVGRSDLKRSSKTPVTFRHDGRAEFEP
mgnify:CR=1 FL=1